MSDRGQNDDLPSVSIALASVLRALEDGTADEDAGQTGPTTVSGTWLPDRYTDLGQLGIGGMGEVRRVLDRRLNRPVAMKVIRPSMVFSDEAMARFLEEAQIAAQLEHPGIVPVYDAGRLKDGRAWFTMKEVVGVTLDTVIDSVHRASQDGTWGASPDGWTLRRLVGAFARLCEAMAYAHARRVIHRDLKPDNVMIGRFGEVLLLDWGLGKVLHRSPPALSPKRSASPDLSEVRTERTERDLYKTAMGDVGGTVMYMAPEQAQGRIGDIGPAADVYALGAILFHVLGNVPPYRIGSLERLLDAQRAGPPAPPGPLVDEGGAAALATANRLPIPADLWAICVRALAWDSQDRYPDAAELARDVNAWLEGARRQERALAVVREAESLRPRVSRLRERAAELDAQASRLLAKVPPLAPIVQKRPAWEAAAEAQRLARLADLDEERMVQALHAALTHQPDLAVAHRRLAAYYRGAHQAAEAVGDTAAAARIELRLRAHDDGEHAAYLVGDGALTLLTEPDGADVSLSLLATLDHRLVPAEARTLGQTPLLATPLSQGSYLVELSLPGHITVRYPVAIGRLEHWHGVAPGQDRPSAVWLPQDGAVDPRDAYVPAGWCCIGGDPAATRSLPATDVWVDAFVIDRFPVTNRDYLFFLDALLESGRADLAAMCEPREGSARPGVPGTPIYGRREDGGYCLVPDAAGDLWDMDGPVVMVPWTAACAYAIWRSETTGLPWRLPSELEWEKAARGVDGRVYPWGDALDLTWCLTQDSQVGQMRAASVHDFPEDCSIYGVRGLAGNVRDWCREAVGETLTSLASGRLQIAPLSAGADTQLRVSRGGCWYSHHRDARVCSRVQSPQVFRAAGVGIRLVRSVD